MNITTTAIITKGLFGGGSSQMIAAAFGLYYTSNPIMVPVVIPVTGGGSGGGSTISSPSISVNYSSNMFSIHNDDYIETIVIFDGNKKIIQHYSKSMKIAEFTFISQDVNFTRYQYVVDVENDDSIAIDGNATLH